METYRQTNDDSETDSEDTDNAGAVRERGEAAESDDDTLNVQTYIFEPHLAIPDGVDSTGAADGDDANGQLDAGSDRVGNNHRLVSLALVGFADTA